MPYLEKLLQAYEQGLACSEPPPADVLRKELTEATDPVERGALLGALARSVTLDDRECSVDGGMTSRGEVLAAQAT